MQAHLIPCVHACSVAFADNLRATVSTRFPTWHSSLHVWNKWFHVVKGESCQEIINPVRTSTMAESKCNATIIDNFTLETYLCYSNINRTGKSIHSLLHQKTIWKCVCYWIMIVHADMCSTAFTYLFPSIT